MKLCDQECPHLCPNEREQNEQKKAKIPRDAWKHVCSKYDKQMFHGQSHPDIIAIQGCEYSIKGDT